MRYQVLILLMAASNAHAATLEVAVSHDSYDLERYTYQLNGNRQTLDLRDSDRYRVAFKDTATNKMICRDAEYRTGLTMTLRDVEKQEDGRYKIEVIGQVSNLKSMQSQGKLDCGENMVPVIENRAFSDTSVLDVGRPKVMVIDGKTTMILTVKE